MMKMIQDIKKNTYLSFYNSEVKIKTTLKETQKYTFNGLTNASREI